jgi:uncharacterized protein YjiS (DUF1127 family)
VVSAIPTLCLPREHSGLPTRGYAALLHVAIGLFALITREIRTRRDMKKLAELGDRMLRDIGIARSEIEPAVRHGRSRIGHLGFPK